MSNSNGGWPKPPSKKSGRVFLLQSDKPLSGDAVMQIRKQWESGTKGTELDGSKVLILDASMTLLELTGDGIAKVEITEDGRIRMVDNA